MYQNNADEAQESQLFPDNDAVPYREGDGRPMLPRILRRQRGTYAAAIIVALAVVVFVGAQSGFVRSDTTLPAQHVVATSSLQGQGGSLKSTTVAATATTVATTASPIATPINAVTPVAPIATTNPIATATPTVTATPIPAIGNVHNFNVNLCLGVNGGSLTTGARLLLWSCNHNPDQLWHIAANHLINNNNQCLALYANQAAVWACNSNADQQWQVVASATHQGAVSYKNEATGQCLGVSGGATNEGAQVIVWTCNGNADQLWTYQ